MSPTGLRRAAPLLLLAALLASGAEAAELPSPDAPYPFMGTGQDVTTSLRLFAKNVGIGIDVDASVTGKIMIRPREPITRLGYLEQIALESGLVWFFDGTTLHVTTSGNIDTDVFNLRQNDGGQIIRTLRSLGIYQSEFLHRFDARNRVLMISGPAPYLRMTRKAIEAIEKAERVDTTVLRGSVSLAPVTAPVVTPRETAPQP